MQRLTWRNPKHAAQWASTLATYAFPVFGKIDVRDIDTTLVLNVLDPIWSATPETANRVRGRIEAILDWAKPRGYRDGENPARWRGHLDQSLPRLSRVKRAKREAAGRDEHHPAMPYDEIGAFMQRLRARQEMTARMLEFTILTVMRTKTVIGARKREIDLHQRVWNIPETRIGADGKPESSGLKRDGEFRVPLSDAVCRMIEPFAEGDPDDHLFPGDGKSSGLSNMAMLNLLQQPDRMALPQYTVHGFRSTFRDWGGDCTNFEGALLELALAHTLPDKVEAAYRRRDGFKKRQRLMDAWAGYCDKPKAASRGKCRRSRRAPRRVVAPTTAPAVLAARMRGIAWARYDERDGWLGPAFSSTCSRFPIQRVSIDRIVIVLGPRG
jgi:integrase